MTDFHRTERDSFGPIDVPTSPWGARHSALARVFPISTEKMPEPLIRAP
jgi:fumarate hydratase class II